MGVLVTPHDPRRTFNSRLLAKTGDRALAQRAMGPADPKTTVRYDLRGDAALAKVMRGMETPDQRQGLAPDGANPRVYWRPALLRTGSHDS